MSKVIILGATGSIGSTALQAIREKHLDIDVVALSCHTQLDKLRNLQSEFHSKAICLTGKKEQGIYSGFEGLQEMLCSVDADIVLNGIAGFEGLKASVFTLQAGKNLALANKESVVCGSSFLFDLAKRQGCDIIPVDSEHSAIYELLRQNDKSKVQSLIITASGGPFSNYSAEQLKNVTVEEALHHPTWKMGPKITIDSATLANKAMEVIEASKLFGFSNDRIEVVIHPQSIVHSMIRMKDGAVYAQMGKPNMSLPIINALYPQARTSLVSPLDFANLQLTFFKPDMKKFPLLGLAYQILGMKCSAAIAFNASDEIAVGAFLEKRISFTRIQEIVQDIVSRHDNVNPNSLAEAIELDRKYRIMSNEYLC